MYDNLLAQADVKNSLIGDLRNDRLPPSLLFSGPPASGKLTAALETARLLSCEDSGDWDCPCPACARHRILVHGDLLLLGQRTFPEELTIALEMLERSPGRASAHFFLRAVNKLLRRFDRSLWEGEEGRLAKAAPLLREAEETLSYLDPGAAREGALPKGFAESAASAAKACAKLETFVPDAPPVFMVRNMELWARTAPSGRRKTVVVENADRMLDSARNAMLKILEEPPHNVRFILLTSRRAAVMATILSRSRTYPFAARDASAVATVLRRVFRTDEHADSLENYIESRKPFPPARAKALAEAFTGALFVSSQLAADSGLGSYAASLAAEAAKSGDRPTAVLDELASATGDFGAKDERLSGSFMQFIKALLDVLGNVLRDPESDTRALILTDRWSRLARDAAVQYGSFNRNPDLLLRVLATTFGDSI
ncbi:MAG: hypothetical protein WAZ99_08640 [Rectinemataceae bacterium]